MKVIIAGSRKGIRIGDVIDAIKESGFEITQVVSGCCPTGVDSIGEWLARVYFDRPIPVQGFPPKWDKFGRAAGPIRNQLMASYADALILVWDGKSPGSASMLKLAKQYKIKIYNKVVK